MWARFGGMVLLLSLIGLSTAQGQTRFKVLAVRGQVKADTRSVSVGQHLKASEKLTLPANSYISLAHNNGRTVELRKAGSYKLADLDKAAQKKSGSATGKYATYVLNELTEVQEPVSFTSTRRSNMKTTGSVDRVEGDEVNLVDSVLTVVGGPGELQALAMVQDQAITSGSMFSVIMPRHTRLLTDTLMFTWHRAPSVRSYRVVVMDATNRITFSKETSDTSLAMQTTAMGMADGTVYYWHVENANDAAYRTGEYCLYRVAGTERDEVNDMVAAIREDLESDESAIGKIVLASAFDEMGLHYEAYKTFADAVFVAPDVQNYKRLFAEFLKREGLNVEAYEVYR